MGYIYLIENTINGHNYVGQTKGTVEKRFKQHIHDSKSKKTHTILHKALLKYGVENFVAFPLYEVPDDKLNDWEIFEISYRKSIGEAQYNTAYGGYNAPFFYKTDEEKIHIVEKAKSTHKNKSDEEKEIEFQNRSQAMTGNKNPMYGKHHSEETKEKIRKSYSLERIETYRINNSGELNPMFQKTPWNKNRKMSTTFIENCRLNNSGANNPNYGKFGGQSANHRPVILYFQNGATLEFECKKDCALYLGYSQCGLKMNKVIKSKNPLRNGCIVKYK